jgi:hypothetical protein
VILNLDMNMENYSKTNNYKDGIIAHIKRTKYDEILTIKDELYYYIYTLKKKIFGREKKKRGCGEASEG